MDPRTWDSESDYDSDSDSVSDSRKRTRRFPIVQEIPVELDWKTWCRDALAFSLLRSSVMKIYAVNTIDYSCYYLADFSFEDLPPHPLNINRGFVASCTMIGSILYLLGSTRKDDIHCVSTQLLIWDVSEAQEKKLRGEQYEWKAGPDLNSAKFKVLSFSLGGHLYAFDPIRRFCGQKGAGPFHTRITREKNPHDFERLCSDSNSEGTLCWMNLPSLCVEKYESMRFCGYCCLEDSRVVIHTNSFFDSYPHYFFCFDVKANTWTHHKFSGLPLVYHLWEDFYMGEEDPEHNLRGYCCQVQEYALFLHPFSSKLSVFNFNDVFEAIKNSDVPQIPFYKYPYSTVEVDQSYPHALKDFHLFASFSFEGWKTYQLGAKTDRSKRFCCLGFFNNCEREDKLYLCIWSVELDEHTSNGNKVFSARNDVAKILQFERYMHVHPTDF